MRNVASTSCAGIDADLFPLLQIFSCTSTATASSNGPRYCAQDKVTGCIYEVRMCKLPTVQTADRDTPRRSTSSAATLGQQARIDALMNAGAAGDKLPWCVALPIDVYMQEQTATGDLYVACVDVFGGLSLGDLLRAGWRVVEESVFRDILASVEEFSKVCRTLPPHNNFTADAMRQVLTVRDGLTEASRQSRWVVGDWALVVSNENGDDLDEAVAQSCHENSPHHNRLTPRGVERTVADVEWVLHSTFAQLGVSADGVVLSPSQIEAAINETMRRVRANVEQRICLGTGEAPGVTPDATALAAMRQDVTHASDALLTRLRQMSPKEKLSYHQAAVRQEQLLVNKYRRRNAPLPPLPQPPGAGRPCAVLLDEPLPASRCVSSQLHALRSALWGRCMDEDAGGKTDDARCMMGDVACAVAALCHAGPVGRVALGDAVMEQARCAQRATLRTLLRTLATASQNNCTTCPARTVVTNARVTHSALTHGVPTHGAHPGSTSAPPGAVCATGRQRSPVQQPPLAPAATPEATRTQSPSGPNTAASVADRTHVAAAAVVVPATPLRQPSTGAPAVPGNAESRRPYVKPLPLNKLLQARERVGFGSARSAPRAHTAGRALTAVVAPCGAASARNATPRTHGGRPAVATARTPRSGRHVVAAETAVASQRGRKELLRTPTFATHAAASAISFTRNPYAPRNPRPHTPLRKAVTHTAVTASAQAIVTALPPPGSLTVVEGSDQTALPAQHVNLVRTERSASPLPKPPEGCIVLDPPRERSMPVVYAPTTAAVAPTVERAPVTTVASRIRVTGAESLHVKPTATRVNPIRHRSPPRRPLTTVTSGLLTRHATRNAAPGAGDAVAATRHPTRTRPATAEAPAMEVLIRRRTGKVHT